MTEYCATTNIGNQRLVPRAKLIGHQTCPENMHYIAGIVLCTSIIDKGIAECSVPSIFWAHRKIEDVEDFIEINKLGKRINIGYTLHVDVGGMVQHLQKQMPRGLANLATTSRTIVSRFHSILTS